MTIIDRSRWQRRELFDFFSTISHPFFNVAFPLDVTSLRAYTKREGLSFYHSLTWLVSRAMNSVAAFRHAIRGDDIVLLDERLPSFTTLRSGSETFQIITLPAGDDLRDFCARAAALCAEQTAFIDLTCENDALIYISCLPWFPITALTSERDVNPDDTIPRIAWGKYEQQVDGRLVLSMSVECNHRMTDGVHVGQFYEALRGKMARL